MTISRRDLLAKAGALSVSSALPGCGDDEGGETGTEGGTGDDGLPHYEFDGEPGPEDLFQHGVASGDPLPDAVILWTRVTGATEPQVEVFFEVALDPEFTMRVAADYGMALADADYTAKVDVTGLDPATTYFYRFYALGRESVVGRTRTAPSGPIERLRFGVTSCSSLAHGFFHSYRRMSERTDLDVVLHLGDYIYEYGNGEYGDVRTYEPPTEIISLEDYRMRYSQYRRDPDLQELHRQHPIIAIWDDHEVADNAWKDGAENHQASEGDYQERKSAAEQVYREWMPIREVAPEIVYRSFSYGDLVSLILLDTRHVARDEQASTVQDTESIDDPARQLLGEPQEAWLEQELGTSSARWKLVGQQVVLGQTHIAGGLPFNVDAWDGYEGARTRFFDIVEANAPTNLVVLTGDIHSSWAMDLARDPYGMGYDPQTGAGALGVEIVTPAVTAEGFTGALLNTIPSFLMENPHLHWLEGERRGYVVLDITAERVQATWWHVADITTPMGGTENAAAVFAVYDGTNHLVEEAASAEPPVDAPPAAP
jgi:alkaline phosphatase D